MHLIIFGFVDNVMMPVLFFLFVALGVYIFTIPSSSGGYKYIFTLNPKGLLNPQLWLFAFGQAFFSLSVAGFQPDAAFKLIRLLNKVCSLLVVQTGLTANDNFFAKHNIHSFSSHPWEVTGLYK